MVSKDNIIIRKLFREAELSYALSDIIKAIGPVISLLFVSLFVGTDGVTAASYVSPLITFFELIGTAYSSGARTKVSALVGEGESEDTNSAFSSSLIMSGGICIILVIIVIVFRSSVAYLLGARDPEIQQMTADLILGYFVGFPFFTLTRTLTPFLQMEGQYRRVSVIAFFTTFITLAADAVVIFILKGGMLEIGLASSLGYIIPFFIVAAFFVSKKRKSAFRMSFKSFKPKLGFEIIKCWWRRRNWRRLRCYRCWLG